MQPPLKMKDLEAQTGVSREAIHFYLREGLLPEPDRPKRNVAHYCDEHVIRIRAIKQLQQERSLSLEAIKRILSEFDYEAAGSDDDLAQLEVAVQARVNGALPGRDQDVTAVTEKTGLSRRFLNELDALGVISFKHHGRKAMLDFRDVGVLEQWSALMQLGFDGKAGYDARYLERYAQAIKAIAAIEVDTFLSVFSGESSDVAARLAAEGIGITNEILSQMRTQALMRELHDKVGAPDS